MLAILQLLLPHQGITYLAPSLDNDVLSTWKQRVCRSTLKQSLIPFSHLVAFLCISDFLSLSHKGLQTYSINIMTIVLNPFLPHTKPLGGGAWHHLLTHCA